MGDSVVGLIGDAVRLLVDIPEDVRVSEHRIGGKTIIEVDTNPSDTGKVIGKAGQTVSALRQLVKALSGRFGTNYQLEVVEHGQRQGRPEYLQG